MGIANGARNCRRKSRMECLLGIDSVASDIFPATSKAIKKNQLKTSTN